MRKRLAAAIAGILIAVAAPGCRRKKITPPADAAGDAETGLSSSILMADPLTAFQLVRGFHGLEQGSWRWTMQRFSAALKPPAQKGANLVVNFSIPEAVLKKTGRLTLSATVGTLALGSQTYTKAGEAVYSQSVPPGALTGETAAFDFELDHALAAGQADSRELGVIVTRISLDAP